MSRGLFGERRLRVIQLCADRGVAPGATKGAAQHLRGIASGLQNHGHDVTTFAARTAEGPFPVEARPLAELTRAEVESADVVYERYSLGHRRGLDLANECDVPFVLEVNAPLVDEARTHRPETVNAEDDDIERELLRHADLVIAVSQDLASWIQTRRTRPAITLSNGFEPSWIPPGPSRTPVPSLVFMGHPKPWHGADRLVDLLVDLRVLGLCPSLTVIGGGPGADAMLLQAAAAGVIDQLTVTGALPPGDASALLANATIGLAPYPRIEPFYFCPLKIVDYLAAGLAIVSTRQGDVPHLVGNAGVVVAPEDRPGYAAAVARLLTDPELCGRLGRNGRDRALATMTWDHVAASTIDAVRAAWPALST